MNKRPLKLLIAAVLLGSLTIQADPIRTWSWDGPFEYENAAPIPGGDLTDYTLHCSNNLGDPNVPWPNRYEAQKRFEMQTPPSIEDMDFIVGGLPGTYYCAATVASLQYGTTSGYSNEVPFVVPAGVLGFVPKPPILSLK